MLSGTCHCGAVRIELDRKPKGITECNCSVCWRYGVLWAYDRKEAARVIAETGALEVYAWGRKDLGFHRCRACGCVIFWEPLEGGDDQTRIGVNVRLLPFEEIAEIPIRQLDGAKSWKEWKSALAPDIAHRWARGDDSGA